MLRSFTKIFSALVLLLVLWGLSEADSGRRSWVRLPGSIPGHVRILQFRASVGSVAQGEKAQLCYGVENAKSVRISPVAARVYPSANHCVEVVPQYTTHYMILAEGYDGSVATRSLILPVESGAPAPRTPLLFAALQCRLPGSHGF